MKFSKFFSGLILVWVLTLTACGGPEQFGEAVNETGALTVDALVQKLSQEKEFETTVSGKIRNACHSEGCWLEFEATDGSLVLVTYKDKAFHLPTGIEGRTAVVRGTAYVDSVTVDEQKAQAKEDGKTEAEINAITQTEYSLALEAVGVLLKEK